MRCKMSGIFILREHRPTCSSVVLIVKTVLLNFEYVKYSSLLNTLKGNCFDDGQYVYCTNSRGTKAHASSEGLVILAPQPIRSQYLATCFPRPRPLKEGVDAWYATLSETP